MRSGMTKRPVSSSSEDRQSRAWSAYVPHLVKGLLERYSGRNPAGHAVRAEAVVLFGDLSGFTPMAEALGARGRHGTEELSILLNRHFGAMVRLAHSFGGDTIRFGGDSLMALFPYSAETYSKAARRAIHCALDMQRYLSEQPGARTSAGDFPLSMRVGMAAGCVVCAVVGDPTRRLEYVVAGGALDNASQAQAGAGGGEVVGEVGLLEAAGVAGDVARRGRFAPVVTLTRGPAPETIRPEEPDPPADVDPLLERFLPPPIARRIEIGQPGFVDEHRQVSVMFVGFQGFDYDHDRRVAAKLQDYLSGAMDTVHNFGGHFAQVETGDKGSKFLVFFGAPVAHEDDATRALKCALELQHSATDSLRIGLTTGLLFSGAVGSEIRREYLAIGGSVNLAARLMQAARPGEILTTEAVRLRNRNLFRWEERHSVTLKGLANRRVFALSEGAQGSDLGLEPAPRLPFAGRDQEIEGITALLSRVAEGQGSVIGVGGEAGIGKSRLCTEIVKLASSADFDCFVGEAQSYGPSVIYQVWRSIWRAFFNLNADQSHESQAAQLRREVEALDSSLGVRVPLLAPVLNLPIEENETTASLDPKTRSESLKALLLHCIRKRSERRPILLVLDNYQSLDELSMELLLHIGRNIHDCSIGLVAAYRIARGDASPFAEIMAWEHATELQLGELAVDDADRLIAAKIDQLFGPNVEQSTQFRLKIAHEGHGNPLYLEELVSFLHSKGTDPRDSQALDELPLPDALTSLVMARIDQLTEEHKATLKSSSVIGLRFRSRWVWGSYPQIGSRTTVERRLRDLNRMDLTQVVMTAPEVHYAFKHSLTHQVTYDSIAFEHRARLHEQVGAFIEDSYASHLDEYVMELAHHYGNTRNERKQHLYFHRAADKARTTYANDTAIEYYERLLPLLRREEEAPVMRKMGEVRQLTGKLDVAESLFRRALESAQSVADGNEAARAQAALGYLMTYTESFNEALVWLQQASHGFERSGDDGGLSLALEYLSHTYFFLGRYQETVRTAQRHLHIATRSDDLAGMSAAYGNIGRAYWHQQLLDEAVEALGKQLALAEQAGDRKGVTHACNDIAGVYSELGRQDASVDYLFRALEAALQIGYQLAASVIVGNAGLLYRDAGDHDRAFTCLVESLRVALEIGHWPGMLNVMGELAVLRLLQGREDESEQLFERTLEVASVLSIPHFTCVFLIHQADLLASRRRQEEARETARRALTIADDIEAEELQLRAKLRLIRFNVSLTDMDLDAARLELDRLLEEDLTEEQQAAVQLALYDLGDGRRAVKDAAVRLYRRLYQSTHKVEYRNIYEKLTSERLPDPPPLPPLPESIGHERIDLEELLARVDALLGATRAARAAA
jgi:class 3 adenylate cyclase/tetratricopeptide (TPR) repeat protein